MSNVRLDRPKFYDEWDILGGKTLKVCSLKVSEERAGRRFGELLLKALFQYLHENDYEFVFLSVFSHHDGLISLLEDFGFERREPDKTSTGERYYVKTLAPTEEERLNSEPLEFHIRFGPPAVKIDAAYLVPIQPRFHRVLFPDGEPHDLPEQLELNLVVVSTKEPKPFGNALRKAYLSRSHSRQLRRGATLLFYRSWDLRAITSVGVVEETLKSGDASEVVSFVGQRSVYSLDEIAAMCDRGEILAIRFRQDRLLKTPINLDEMVAAGISKQHPQSIQAVPPEVNAWLAERIDA